MPQKLCPASSFIIRFVIVVLLLSSCASSKFAIEKTPLDQHFENHPVFRESQSGIMVYHLDENKVLFDYNSHKHFTPASNTKLLTYYAALKMMGDSIPTMEYCISNDTLYFSGTGDPTLLYQNVDYGKGMDFLSQDNTSLVYIPKTTDDERFGPGWSWDDYPYYFSAEKSSFPIYGNMAYFKKNPAEDYVRVVPGYFENHLLIVQDPDEKSFSVHRKEFTNEFELRFNGVISEFEEELPFIYSDELFVHLLSDTLQKPVRFRSRFPECNMQTWYSFPTDSITKQILIESDNFLAEQMLLMASQQLGDTLSSRKSIAFMMEHHLSSFKEEINWVDGSGLSRYNQVTPNALVSVLKAIYLEVGKEKLYHMLPESGASGTLKNSFNKLSGKIHAKTGSMQHVYNLSGYFETNSGKTLLFSFMNNNFNVSFGELKLEMEKILAVFVNDN
jgi:D-alanyl-D-alanine carboxypeptidase/D-alanyl-D-alanine-endopeptidase (penicillin-binding protein 4)